MFSGALVDTRSTKQKRTADKREKPKQLEMFAAREVAQFGVDARPSLPITNSRGMPIGMALEIQDPRTEEDKEYDRMKAAQAATYGLFGQYTEPSVQPPQRTKLFPSGMRFELHEIEAQEEPNLAVRLAEGIDLYYYSSRDTAYEESDSFMRRYGYRAYRVGEDQLELWKMDDSGYFRIMYSLMEMIDDIEWIDHKGGL